MNWVTPSCKVEKSASAMTLFKVKFSISNVNGFVAENSEI